MIKKTFFKGDDAQARKGVQQFSRLQQKIGTAGFANGFVSSGEGFINEQTSWCQTGSDEREQRPPQLVGHNDRAKLLCVIDVLEWPGAIFQIR